MYKIKSLNEEFLSSKGFEQNRDGVWQLRFPVYWWNHMPIIFCNATVDPCIGKRINIEVVREDGSIHKQWLEKNYVQAGDLLKNFEREIDKKMSRIDARKFGEIND